LARDDLADPAADDPVLRESSKLQAAVLHSTQATYDLTRWDRFLGPGNPAWWHSPDEPAQFYHLRTMADLETENARRILRECDMLHWISPGDGPVFVSNNQPDTPPKDRGHYLHHPAHAREIRNACAAAGVPCVWVQAAERTEGERRPADPVSFVLRALGAASPGAE
jgi:hypothetical protein